jgi:hypothetical protein
VELPSGVHRAALRALDDDQLDTRPMPKRARSDFASIHRLGASIDTLAIEATAWQVAGRGASAMAEALQADAVLIHQHDALRSELRCIAICGTSADDLLGSITKVNEDPLVTAVLKSRKPLVLRFDGALRGFRPERHRVLGTSGSLTIFPAFSADGCVAILEIAGVGDERQAALTDASELVARRLIAAFRKGRRH